MRAEDEDDSVDCVVCSAFIAVVGGLVSSAIDGILVCGAVTMLGAGASEINI